MFSCARVRRRRDRRDVGTFEVADFIRAVRPAANGTYEFDLSMPDFAMAQDVFRYVAAFPANGGMKPTDRVRIRYTDGVVVEFSIWNGICAPYPARQCRYPATINLKFEKVVSTPRETSTYPAPVYSGSGSAPGSYVGIATGYWGQSGNVGPDGTVTITASWFDTGTVSVYVPNPGYNINRTWQ